MIPLISKNNIIKEYKELNKNLDHQLGEVQSGLKDDIVKTNTAAEGREKILEAKIEDMEDRLRQCYSFIRRGLLRRIFANSRLDKSLQ